MSWLTPFRSSRLPALMQDGPLDDWVRSFFTENGRFPDAGELRHLPRANVAETDKDFLVTMELPGMEEADIDVRVTGDQLVVSGERKQKKEDKDKHYYRMETTYGAFERRFELPLAARKDADAVKATFHKGMLEILIPKAEPKPVAKIPVKAV